MTIRRAHLLLFLLSAVFALAPAQQPSPAPSPTLTPPTPHTPAIHGPKVFGVRPGSPFLYTIPATGDRPLTFAASNLPHGLKLDPATGQITGSLPKTATYHITLIATNKLGTTQRPFEIRVGSEIGLTPAMGWNSYNVWGANIDSPRVLAAARAMVASGLAQHGFTYINMDDGWQGTRSGPLNALQPDPKAFTDMRQLVNQIHALGLKVGIYHTPWVTSYGGRTGGSSNSPAGTWDHATMTKGPKNIKVYPFAIGTYHFTQQDATQFAQWGIDYLKYDWGPVEAPETIEERTALNATGRDILLSLSNNASHTLLGEISKVAPYANSWRTGHDIDDSWSNVLRNGFQQDAWAPYASPGHFNDPDMLVLGVVGWGHPHPTRLTPDEQYTHVSLWCLTAAPLILGNDLTQLDPFTLSLLTNDEVLDIDQDALGKQATLLSQTGDIEIYSKPLADGTIAVGLFNLGLAEASATLRFGDLHLTGKQTIRDLWRQRDLGTYPAEFSASVPSHGVVLIRAIPAR